MGTGHIENSVSGKRLKMLVVDDDRVTRDLLCEVFELRFEVELVESGERALEKIKTEQFPIVLSDIRMLELTGLELLTAIKASGQRSVVILMTGFGNMEGAIEAIQKGAFEYLSKPFRLEELKATVARAVEHWKLLGVPHQASQEIVPLDSKTLIGKSPAIVEVYKTLARASMSRSHVLILGESGTGKELVARAIHDHSPRRAGRFVAVNCGALSENLLESELFGHVRGAFTGAIGNKRGLFEEADGGTLFLDEIGDVSVGLQVKLLRVIQDREFRPVGGEESRKIDVRVIAATHRNLDQAVRQGKFREDLYYRLKVILIVLPALRDRREDLPELINHFVSGFSKTSGKAVSHISDQAMASLIEYDWPGNVRELEHAIERAMAMCRTTVLHPEDFPPEIRRKEKSAGGGKQASLESIERAHIVRVLEEAKFNKSRAAEILGIDRKTLQRKTQRYGISLKEAPIDLET